VLSEATKHSMRQRPGFVSANLHISQDKRHVANYAQWRTQADVEVGPVVVPHSHGLPP